MAKDEKILTLKKGYRLTATKLKEQDVAQQRFMAIVDAGTPYEEVLKPVFWTHVAKKFRKFAKISVVTEDGAYYAELLVVIPLEADTVVKELLHIPLEAVKEPGSILTVGEYTISFHGLNAKWRVSRDKRMLKEGFATSSDAQLWAKEYAKAVA